MQDEVSISIEWESKGAISTFKGKLNSDCVYRCDHEITSNSQFADCDYLIYDFLNADTTELDFEESHKIAAKDAVLTIDKPELKLILVANTEDSKFFCEEYIKQAKALYSTWEFRIFDEVKSARDWIHS